MGAAAARMRQGELLPASHDLSDSVSFRAAWKALGFPLSTKLADPRAEMERLGIEVFPPLSSSHTEVAAASE